MRMIHDRSIQFRYRISVFFGVPPLSKAETEEIMLAELTNSIFRITVACLLADRAGHRYSKSST
jgi:hypothetical protein